MGPAEKGKCVGRVGAEKGERPLTVAEAGGWGGVEAGRVARSLEDGTRTYFRVGIKRQGSRRSWRGGLECFYWG